MLDRNARLGFVVNAGVCYKNTTLHFQSSNTERAPAPLNSRPTGSAAEGPGPGPGPQRWELQGLFPARRTGGRHPTTAGLGGARLELMMKGRS